MFLQTIHSDNINKTNNTRKRKSLQNKAVTKLYKIITWYKTEVKKYTILECKFICLIKSYTLKRP